MVQIFSPILRRCARGKVRLRWDDALLGLDTRYSRRSCTFRRPQRHDCARFDNFHLDAHDFYNSDMFDGSSSGVGGWGDPTNDYQISTGGFKDLIVAYPTSHRIRRDFALRLSIDHNPPPLFTDQTAPLPPKGLMINTTTAEESVTYSVNNFVGDFIGFQAYIESPHVSSTSPPLLFGCPDPSV